MDMSNAERRKFGIEGLTLEIPAPYTAGHTVNEAEANVLNQVIAENCRNNLREDVKKALGEGKTPADVQAMVDEYMVDYEFGAPRAVGPRLDPVEAAAMEIAVGIAKKLARRKGEKLAELGMAELRKRGKELIDGDEWGPKIRERAKQIAAAKDLEV